MKPSILCWNFQENLWFFEVFEIVRTGGSSKKNKIINPEPAVL
jgi:hypothetical protein